MASRLDHHIPNIQKAVDTIEVELRHPIEIEGLAAHSGMSYWHFQHTFRRLLGEPVASYIRRRRLTEIARELRHSSRPMIETALDFQFQSHVSFTRAFRGVFGLTPVEFRRQPRSLRSSRRRPPPDYLPHVASLPAEPEIVTMPELRLAGLSAPYRGVTSERPNDTETIPDLWNAFALRQGELRNIDARFRYGAWDFVRSETSEDEYTALASVHISGATRPPPEMTVWTAPAGRYARFTHRAPARLIRETISYIYTGWLPRSGLERGRGFDYLRFDERYQREDRQIQLDYYLPLRK